MEPLTSWDVPDAKQQVPPSVAKALSYYAASTYGMDLKQDYRQSVAEFQNEGMSQIVESAQKKWIEEQDQDAQVALEGILRDQSLPQEMKRGAVASYVMSGYIAEPLREKYKRQVGSRDLSKTAADQRAQDTWMLTMQKRDQEAAEVQEIIDRFGTTLDSTFVEDLAGVSRDVLPLAQLAWNFSVAGTAKKMGVGKPWDLFLPGTANKRIKETYNNLPIEAKKEFVQKIIDSYNDTPSFDINKWLDFQAQIEREVEPQWMTTLDDVAGVLNWIGLGFLTRAPSIAAKTKEAGKARPYTPKPKPGSGTRTGETFEGEATRVTDDALELRGPTVSPRSPAGTTATANPRAASTIGAAAIADASGEAADALGTSRGAIVSDWVLPKLDDSINQIYPDLAEELSMLDKTMRGVFIESRYNPAVVAATQRERDSQIYFNTIKEVNGPHYQQSNSVYEETAGSIAGRALFGRNEAYGYDTLEEALEAVDIVANTVKNIGDVKSNATRVVKRGDQFYVQWDYEKAYDAFEHLAFGDKSVSFKFAGVNADAVARSWLAKFLPPTMRMDTWVPFGAASAERHAAKVENDFIRELRVNVAQTPHKTELYNLLRATEETGEYLRPHQIHSMYPDLNETQMKDLVRSYTYFRRLVDYEYNWANRLDKADKAARGYKGIYINDGEEILFGTPDFPAGQLNGVRKIMDLEEGLPINMPKDDEILGRTIVRLESPIVNEHGVFDFGILAERNARIGPLPAQTLPRIEGYIPRRNKENYYVMKIPKASVINGNKVTDAEVLRNYSKVIGAGDTKAKADLLKARFEGEFPDFTIEVRADRGDTGIAVITDYKVRKESMDFGRKRGERLPTVDGPARIEDPLISLIETIKTTTRMDAWRDYTEAFQKNFMDRYGKWTRDNKFPESESDFVPKRGMTAEDTREFKSAQRLYEQWVNQQYKNTFGDEMWDGFFYNLSTVFEKLPVNAKYHQFLKDIGKKGNLAVRLPKTLATHLFMYSNVPRQWIIQPQQLAELTFLEPLYAVKAPAHISGVFGAILARAKAAKDYRESLEELSFRMSGMNRQEFKDTVDAIHKSGLPQSIDLNMTLHGALRDVERPLVESTGRKVAETAKTVIGFPTGIGKMVGYSSAELTNQIGLWLFARARWKKNNPGKNWNTPENIEEITNQAWDIGHSMSTRAGALPFQDGAISLIMQFAAVQHKAFWQVFSSKTLKSKEKATLAASRMALYGVYGVPGALMVDAIIDKYGPEEYQEKWDKWKRGIQDYVVNNLANMFLNPEDPQTDLAVSQTSSPMPQTLPYLDLLIELAKFRKDTPESPRFPFTHATGSLFEAADDISALIKVKEMGTPESLQIAAGEAMEIFSGYNNFAKAMMIKNYGDKISKFGSPLGLELNRIELVAQMFGIVTNKELAIYAADRKGRERKKFIEDHAKYILNHLEKIQAKDGSGGDMDEWYSRISSMMAFVDEDVRDEVIEEIGKQDRQNFLTKNESVMLKIFQGYKEQNDRYVAEMIEDLEASENPKAKQLLEQLKKQGIKR